MSKLSVDTRLNHAWDGLCSAFYVAVDNGDPRAERIEQLMDELWVLRQGQPGHTCGRTITFHKGPCMRCEEVSVAS